MRALVGDLMRRVGEADVSATLLWVLSVTNEPATLASTQIAHLPLLNSARFSLKPLLEAPGGPVAHGVDVEVQGVLPLRAGEFRLPFSSNQRAP
jgi:hypothetical protein